MQIYFIRKVVSLSFCSFCCSKSLQKWWRNYKLKIQVFIFTLDAPYIRDSLDVGAPLEPNLKLILLRPPTHPDDRLISAVGIKPTLYKPLLAAFTHLSLQRCQLHIRETFYRTRTCHTVTTFATAPHHQEKKKAAKTLFNVLDPSERRKRML